MSAVANISVNLDASKALGSLKELGRSVDTANGNFKGFNTTLGAVGSTIASLGLGALTKELGNAGIDADRTAKRIKALTGETGETDRVMGFAAKAAKEFGLGTTTAEKGVADLYGRLRPMGISLTDIETTFSGVNKAALAMGLSGADTSNVFLQLGQAMGSGKLQGDELRSIMEQLPAVGQAVAKVMGVTVGEIKQLGADGMITTDILVQAMGELNKMKPPPPDAFRQLSAAMEDLQRELGENLVPILLPLAQGLLKVVQAFGQLPEPVQTAIVAVLAIATAVAGIATAVGLVAPAIGTFLGLLSSIGAWFAASGIAATIAGWAGAIGPAIGAITTALGGLLTWLGSTFLPAIVAFFSGPVGWTVLAVAAVVAMCIYFREPIMQFLSWLWDWLGQAFTGFGQMLYQWFVEPWIQVWEVVSQAVQYSLETIGGILNWAFQAWIAIMYQIWVRPFVELWNNVLREPVMGFLEWVGGAFSAISEWFNAYVVEPISKAWGQLVNFLGNIWSSIRSGVQQAWSNITKAFDQYVGKPIAKIWQNIVDFIPKAISNAVKSVQGFFQSLANGAKQIVRNMLQAIANAINNVARTINDLIRKFNALPGPDIPLIGQVSVPAFAEGGYVNRPTLALIGEGGEGEYIVPESKATDFAQQWLASQKQDSISKLEFPGLDTGRFGQPVAVNIQTGPVMELNGQRWVTVEDMEKAIRTAVSSTLSKMRTPTVRQAMGLL